MECSGHSSLGKAMRVDTFLLLRAIHCSPQLWSVWTVLTSVAQGMHHSLLYAVFL